MFIGPLKAIESYPTCLHNAQYTATKTFKMAATSSLGFWTHIYSLSSFHTAELLAHSLAHSASQHYTNENTQMYDLILRYLSNHNNKKGRHNVCKKRFLVRESWSQDCINFMIHVRCAEWTAMQAHGEVKSASLFGRAVDSCVGEFLIQRRVHIRLREERERETEREDEWESLDLITNH